MEPRLVPEILSLDAFCDTGAVAGIGDYRSWMFFFQNCVLRRLSQGALWREDPVVDSGHVWGESLFTKVHSSSPYQTSTESTRTQAAVSHLFFTWDSWGHLICHYHHKPGSHQVLETISQSRSSIDRAWFRWNYWIIVKDRGGWKLAFAGTLVGKPSRWTQLHNWAGCDHHHHHCQHHHHHHRHADPGSAAGDNGDGDSADLVLQRGSSKWGTLSEDDIKQGWIHLQQSSPVLIWLSTTTTTHFLLITATATSILRISEKSN